MIFLFDDNGSYITKIHNIGVDQENMLIYQTLI